MWHFFATSHGKGPCDAVGGILKRMAKRVSLAKENENPIKSAIELYEWAVRQSDEGLTKIAYCFVANEEYNVKAEQLAKLYEMTKTISGTQSFHSFIPVSQNEIAAKRYSSGTATLKHFNMFKKK